MASLLGSLDKFCFSYIYLKPNGVGPHTLAYVAFGPGCVRAELSSANFKSSSLVQSVHLVPVRCCSVTFFISQSMITSYEQEGINYTSLAYT